MVIAASAAPRVADRVDATVAAATIVPVVACDPLYVSHLLGTCAIALEFGANQD
jgi:hypothetical protein